MPFGPFTVNSQTFNPIGDGKYMKSTVLAGQPGDWYKVTGATPNRDKRYRTGSITRTIQVDVTNGSNVERLDAIIQIVVTFPYSGVTPTTMDNALNDTASWMDPSILNRILMGES